MRSTNQRSSARRRRPWSVDVSRVDGVWVVRAVLYSIDTRSVACRESVSRRPKPSMRATRRRRVPEAERRGGVPHLRHVYGGSFERLLPRTRRVGVSHWAAGVFVGDALYLPPGFHTRICRPAHAAATPRVDAACGRFYRRRDEPVRGQGGAGNRSPAETANKVGRRPGRRASSEPACDIDEAFRISVNHVCDQ